MTHYAVRDNAKEWCITQCVIVHSENALHDISGQQGYLSMGSASDATPDGNGTFTTQLALDISVTRALIGAVYVCEVTLDGFVSWSMSKEHTLVVNSESFCHAHYTRYSFIYWCTGVAPCSWMDRRFSLWLVLTYCILFYWAFHIVQQCTSQFT